MHYQRGRNRDQVFMTSLGQLVELGSWARIVDLFAGGVNDMYELGTAGKRAQQISGVQKIDMLAGKGYR